MSHAAGARRQGESERAEKRAHDGDLAVRELLEQRADEQAREVHHDVEHADDDGRTGGAHVQVLQKIPEKQAKRRFNASGCQLIKKPYKALISKAINEQLFSNSH